VSLSLTEEKLKSPLCKTTVGIELLFDIIRLPSWLQTLRELRSRRRCCSSCAGLKYIEFGVKDASRAHSSRQTRRR